MSETSNVLYLEFANYNIPQFKEVKNKEYVYFGEDNNYPDHLIECYLQCAKHNAIINGKCNYIYGDGLVVDDKTSTIEQKAVGQKFIKMMKEFIGRTIKDFEMFDSIAIEVIYNKAGTKVSDLAFMPMSKIRTNKDESLYFYSNDWTARVQDPEKTGYKEIKPFDLKNPIKGSQLAVFKILSPKNGVDKNVYSVPNYIGAISAIESDIEISNFHLNNLKSGFSMGTMINFNDGIPTEEAKGVIEKKIKAKATGTTKAGGLVITFNKTAENAPTITNFTPNDLDKQFIEIGKRIDQEIYTAHNVVSPVLFGVSTEGALGQRNEMQTAYELFQSTYIKVRQGILEDIINGFADLFGVVNKISFQPTAPLKNLIPESSLQRIYDDMDITELREVAGFPAKKKVIEPAQFNAEKKKYTWDNIGVSEEGYKILFERDYEGQSDEDCLMEFGKQTFAKELTENEKAIVDLLGKDPLMPSPDIAKLLKLSTKEVNDLIDSLVDRKYLTSGSEPTVKGEKASEDAKTVDIEVKYRYGWRKGFDTESDIESSREFCKKRLKEKKLYTRSEIENLDNGQGLDVWDSRGGWWNKDGANVPYCRHIFKQVVVEKE